MPKIKAEHDNKPKDPGITLKIEISDALYADFDIFAFVKHSMDYAGWKRDIGSKLLEILKVQATEISGYKLPESKMPKHQMNEEIKEAINKTIDFENTSVFGKIGTERNEMALPLYNLDLSYNLFKRVRRTCRSEFSIPIEIDRVFDRISRVYKMVEEELECEENEYKGLQESENRFMYKDNFTNDPYFVKFRELLSDESVKAVFLEQMKILYLSTGKLDSLIQISSDMDVDEA